MDRAAWEGILKQTSDIIIDELSSHGKVGLLCQGDAAQVRSDDAQAQPTFHPVWPVIGAFAPAEVASQTGNAAKGARALAIAQADPADSKGGYTTRRSDGRDPWRWRVPRDRNGYGNGSRAYFG